MATYHNHAVVLRGDISIIYTWPKVYIYAFVVLFVHITYSMAIILSYLLVEYTTLTLPSTVVYQVKDSVCLA